MAFFVVSSLVIEDSHGKLLLTRRTCSYEKKKLCHGDKRERVARCSHRLPCFWYDSGKRNNRTEVPTINEDFRFHSNRRMAPKKSTVKKLCTLRGKTKAHAWFFWYYIQRVCIRECTAVPLTSTSGIYSMRFSGTRSIAFSSVPSDPKNNNHRVVHRPFILFRLENFHPHRR